MIFKRKKGSKYKNIKTADGFDSKKEAKRFKEFSFVEYFDRQLFCCPGVFRKNRVLSLSAGCSEDCY
jgi:hypothetical protein